MQNNNMLYGFIGVLIGLVIAGGFCYMNHHRAMSNGMMNMDHSSMSGMMGSMTASLNGKTGNEFDKAFIDEMITHHEGAVEMAQMAVKNAGHQEIKDMANAIISAQTTEINQMKSWRSSWFGN